MRLVARDRSSLRRPGDPYDPRVTDAFFRAEGDLFVPTELTRGPWDPGSQHAGPPAGLIAREVERLDGGGGRHVGRITFEILRPVPIAPASSGGAHRPSRTQRGADRGNALR